VDEAGHVAVLVVVTPGFAAIITAIITPFIAAFVAAFSPAPFVHGDDAAHGQAEQGDGRGEEDEAGFHVGLLGGRAVA
jgi:hypothetical protein